MLAQAIFVPPCIFLLRILADDVRYYYGDYVTAVIAVNYGRLRRLRYGSNLGFGGIVAVIGSHYGRLRRNLRVTEFRSGLGASGGTLGSSKSQLSHHHDTPSHHLSMIPGLLPLLLLLLEEAELLLASLRQLLMNVLGERFQWKVFVLLP